MGLGNLKTKIFGRSKTPRKTEDGRDQWPSRTSYVLASTGGAIGFGNLLRYPSQVFNNNGLQWFIPYLMAVSLIAIPALILEVSIGQAYRGGTVVAFNSLHRSTRGLGMGMIWVGYVVTVYYVPMLAYVLKYFQASFKSPLPWVGRVNEFYREDVVADVGPTGGSFNADGSVASYTSYSDLTVVPHLAYWNFFSWFVVWLCLVRGVLTTGKVVYFTMGLPLIVLFVLVGRGASLPNARRGISLFWGEFNGGQLAHGQIWQDAAGQVFYSTGVGFGYFTAYASYNSKMANAVADSIIICCSNAGFETFAAFAVFGTIGFLGMTPENYGRVTSFELGFVTYPAALAKIPGAHFWSALFFFTLFLLGISSSFAMLDACITVIYDSPWANKHSRVWFSTSVCIAAFLTSMLYTTRVGFWLLDAIDTHTSNVALVFVVWAECAASTILYRWRDVTGQVGVMAWSIHIGGYMSGKVIGLAIAHLVDPVIGAIVGLALYFIGVIISLVVAKTPDSVAPSFWGKNVWLSKFWWMGAYSGNQLRRDLNLTVAPPGSKNWRIPVYWAPILRYFSAPVLSIIYSFAYPKFIKAVFMRRNDPLHIFGFIIAHLIVFSVIFSAIIPASLNTFIPVNRREEGRRAYAPQVLCGMDDIRVTEGIEAGSPEGRSSDSDNEKVHGKAYENEVAKH